MKKISTFLLSLTMTLILALSNVAHASDTKGIFYCANNGDRTYTVTVDENEDEKEINPDGGPVTFKLQEGDTDLLPWLGFPASEHGKLVELPTKKVNRMGHLTDYAFSFNMLAFFLTLKNTEGSEFYCSTEKFYLRNL